MVPQAVQEGQEATMILRVKTVQVARPMVELPVEHKEMLAQEEQTLPTLQRTEAGIFPQPRQPNQHHRTPTPTLTGLSAIMLLVSNFSRSFSSAENANFYIICNNNKWLFQELFLYLSDHLDFKKYILIFFLL